MFALLVPDLKAYNISCQNTLVANTALWYMYHSVY
jgi:hypothetical protein